MALRDLEGITRNIVDLPTLPQVVTAIMGLIDDPRSSASDINEIMERDPALAGKILKLVNSAYYGLPNKVSSVKQSIVILVTAALILIPFGSNSLAQDTSKQKEFSAEKMAVDVLLVRPFGILATVFGSAVFVVALPFSALGGNTEETYKKLVVAPAKYTFKRRIGDI